MLGLCLHWGFILLTLKLQVLFIRGTEIHFEVCFLEKVFVIVTWLALISLISRHKSSTNRNNQQNRITLQRILTAYACINNKPKNNMPCRIIAWHCWQEYSDRYRHALQGGLKVHRKRYSKLWILHCTKAQNISLTFC